MSSLKDWFGGEDDDLRQCVCDSTQIGPANVTMIAREARRRGSVGADDRSVGQDRLKRTNVG